MAFIELNVLPLLIQYQDIRNFHVSLTLNNGKLMRYFLKYHYVK